MRLRCVSRCCSNKFDLKTPFYSKHSGGRRAHCSKLAAQPLRHMCPGSSRQHNTHSVSQPKRWSIFAIDKRVRLASFYARCVSDTRDPHNHRSQTALMSYPRPRASSIHNQYVGIGFACNASVSSEPVISPTQSLPPPRAPAPAQRCLPQAAHPPQQPDSSQQRPFPHPLPLLRASPVAQQSWGGIHPLPIPTCCSRTSEHFH